MTRIGLTLNEAKTSIRQARQERLPEGWPLAFGHRSAKKSVSRVRQKIGEVLKPSNVHPCEEVRDQLNRVLRGWAAYFGQGTRLMAYRAVDHHVYTRVRLFLIRRHKVPSPGAGRYPDAEVSGRLGCCACAVSICRRCREPEVKSVGRPDARNGHVRFDERGWETGRRFGVSARTRPRLYPQGFSSHGCAPPRTARHSCHGLACSQEATAMLFLPHNARSVRFRTPSFRKIW